MQSADGASELGEHCDKPELITTRSKLDDGPPLLPKDIAVI